MPSGLHRGEVYWADLNDPEETQGTEQQGRRPVLILQSDKYDYTNTIIIVPLTTSQSASKMPTVVRIPEGAGRLPQEGFALCHQVRAVDPSRLRERIGQIPSHLVEQVKDIVADMISSHLKT